MPGSSILDFLFGREALKKAAGNAKNQPKQTDKANIDIRALAQKQAEIEKNRKLKDNLKKSKTKQSKDSY